MSDEKIKAFEHQLHEYGKELKEVSVKTEGIKLSQAEQTQLLRNIESTVTDVKKAVFGTDFKKGLAEEMSEAKGAIKFLKWSIGTVSALLAIAVSYIAGGR